MTRAGALLVMASVGDPGSGPPSIDPKVEAELVAGLRKLGGRGTLGDIVRATGLPREKTEQDLRAMLGLYRSHLEVNDDGELLYLFDPQLVHRNEGTWGDWLSKLVKWSWSAFVVTFKVSLMLVLVGYVLAFCLLIIVAFVALLGEGDADLDLDFDGGDGDGCLGGLFDSLYFWNVGDVVYVPLAVADEVHERDRRSRSQGVSSFGEPRALEPRYVTDTFKARRNRKHHFYEDVFAFVFGPTVPDPPILAGEREILAFINSHHGVLTLTDLITRTGLGVEEAQQEMTRLLVRYGGDVEVGPGGELLYTFQDIRVTAHGDGKLKFTPAPAPPAWHRFEPDAELTGVSGGRNAMIIAMIAFIGVMSLISPFLLALIPGALILAPFLTVLPLLVCMGFFLIPAGRWLYGLSDRAPRRQRNLRRAILLVIFEHLTRSPDQPMTRQSVRELTRRVLASLQKGGGPDRRKMEDLEAVEPGQIDHELGRILREFDAEVAVGEDGQETLSFPGQLAELREAELRRRRAAAKDVSFGQAIFSTAEDDQGSLAEDIDALEPAEAQATLPPSLSRGQSVTLPFEGYDDDLDDLGQFEDFDDEDDEDGDGKRKKKKKKKKKEQEAAVSASKKR